mgnify:CR=1 FL=1
MSVPTYQPRDTIPFGAWANLTDKAQHLRNELGQLQHAHERLTRQRENMQADLLRQRGDMREAIDRMKDGRMRDAIDVLQSALDYRERTREPRKNRTP